MTAEERGAEMMGVPIGRLPPLAVKFARKLCNDLGGCGEVLLTAWIVYAQCVENLPCQDKNYLASQQDKEWFAQQLILSENRHDPQA